MMRFILSIIVISASLSFGIDNGISRVPYMGWNSWYWYWEDINETKIKAQADALVTTGLRDAGYALVGIDGGWWTQAGPARSADGSIIPNAVKFPNGMKALADYCHARGIKFGLYTDTGPSGCGTAWGSAGHYQQDVNLLASWGCDLVKVDHCGGDNGFAGNAQVYGAFSDSLSKASPAHGIILNVCEWGQEAPWNWAPAIAHSWRTTSDIGQGPFRTVSWDDVMGNFDRNIRPEEQKPGAYNDPDYLLIGGFGLTHEEEKSYFSLWCMSAAPLMLATDLTTITDSVKALVTNPEVITVDQDSLCKQCRLYDEDTAGLQVWAKDLRQGKAVLLFNRSGASSAITLQFGDIGLSGTVSVSDLWSRTDLGTFTNSYSANAVPSHGVVMLKLTGGTPVSISQPDLVQYKAARASSEWDGYSTYSAEKACDGSFTFTRWNAANNTGANEWLEFDFGATTTFDKVVCLQDFNRITGFKIQSWNGSVWNDVYTGGTMGTAKNTYTFGPTTGSKVRLYITSTQNDGGTCPSIWEFAVYSTQTSRAAFNSHPERTGVPFIAIKNNVIYFTSDNAGAIVLSMYNPLGVRVFSMPVKGSGSAVISGTVPPGIYLVRMTGANGCVETRSFLRYN
jgi:hypothetical protein